MVLAQYRIQGLACGPEGTNVWLSGGATVWLNGGAVNEGGKKPSIVRASCHSFMGSVQTKVLADRAPDSNSFINSASAIGLFCCPDS
ncbi:MAG: hypothetical protein A2X46_06915 [Lentisphaerae bacterium GWF2_57_35]|nr:MAG: hypothetical protein A2X46_06915 [Lentisphaerae bacterium GWF2_57_35]